MRALALIIGMCATAVAFAQGGTRLTLGHGSSIDHPRHLAAVHFAKRVAHHSEGRIEIQIFPAASMGDDAAMVRGLLDGTLDMSANSQGAVSKVVPEYAAIGMPFLFPTPEAAWKVLDGQAGRMLAERSAERGLKLLGYWDNGIRHLTNDVRPVRTPADVRGLRIRTPPDLAAADLIKTLGGLPRQIRWSDVYSALQQKVVDGQENPLVNILTGKLYQVQKFLSLTGHRYEVTPFVMARARWDALSEADRAAILAAAAEASTLQRSLAQKENAAAMTDLQRTGMQIDTADVAAFEIACRPVYDQWLASPVGDFLRVLMAATR